MKVKTITDPNEISNSFCKYFSNIGKVLAEKISSSRKLYANYLQTKQEKNPHSIFYSPTDIEEIKKIITALKPRRSKCNDNLSSIFLKQICNEICMPLNILMNKSTRLQNCKGYSSVQKYKSRNDITTYRPISILPVAYKIHLKIIYTRKYHF